MTTTKTKNYHGSKINQYTLVENLGEGSHGVVYKAFDKTRPDEPLAIKVIEDKGNLDTLLIEPELLSRLHHPHIIDLKDYFLYSGSLVLVTEYINGVNLDTYLKQRGKLTEQEVIIFLTQMADALVQAHAKNIIHRDIKLSNILVTGSGENIKFVLVDFGVSRMAEGIQTVKRVAGTYYYMAPEQLRGRPCEQSDLWALGVCSYTLLTGEQPFQADTKEDLHKKILQSIPKFPTRLVGEVNHEWETIIMNLLEKEITYRTASASQLQEGLKKLSSSITKLQLSNKAIKQSSNWPTWERQCKAEIQKNWKLFWLFLLLPTILMGGGGPLISFLVCFVFWYAQKNHKNLLTITAILLIISKEFLNLMFFNKINLYYILLTKRQNLETLDVHESFLNYLSIIIIPVVVFILTFIAVYYLAKLLKIQETLNIYNIFRKDLTDNRKEIEAIKNLIDLNWLNINLRQKYIELLLLSGKIEDAIVEAKLTLEIDPYNLGINLLLATGYFDAKLYEQCIQVCDNYLALCGYSFEFSDLKNKCEQII